MRCVESNNVYEPKDDKMRKISTILSLICGEDDCHSVSGSGDQRWPLVLHPAMGVVVVVTPICANLTTIKHTFIKINPLPTANVMKY